MLQEVVLKGFSAHNFAAPTAAKALRSGAASFELRHKSGVLLASCLAVFDDTTG